ncbi:MAG: hypothetical protein ACPL0C_05200 [Candidatus Bathyarchaeales archaeon]
MATRSEAKLKARRRDFDDVLMESIDETLTSLGESVKQSIYYHLEDKFQISKKEIPKRIEDFANGIEKIFGLGAHFIEILIMKKLYEKIGIQLEWNEDKELIFTNYVEAARTCFMKEKGGH